MTQKQPSGRQSKWERERLLWEGIARELAHQMGTPLSAFMGWLEFLPQTQDPARIANELNQSLARLIQASERLHQIATPLRIEDVILDKICLEVVSYFAPRLPSSGQGIKIHVDVSENLTVGGSPVLLTWALEHLVKNSVDALQKRGGNITIKSSETRTTVTLDVMDDGEGIPARYQKRIFAPGFSTGIGGRGIGLALTRYIIENLHRGELHLLESRLDHGSTFRIILEKSPPR
ncbi:MAG: HAMP domain-containing sensor histidine kinase [bacterium]|nr:HAMP domain-containing sensor histidine kinase [bacterium]